MQKCNPEHIVLISAFKNGEFDNASEILARDHENKYVGPLGVLQITALQMAAWQGNVDLLNQLHGRGADINSIDKIGRCALYYAAYSGNTEVIKWLLEHGGDVDIKIGIYSSETNIPNDVDTANIQYSPLKRPLPIPDCKGRTPLHYAVENNHADVVRILVERGADVNVEDEDRITPLLLAGSAMNRTNRTEMINKFVKIVKILVDAEASVNAIHPETGNTALHRAVKLDSAEATILLKDARPDKCNNSGATPVHIAANRGNIETLRILLEAISSDVDKPDKLTIPDCWGRTPLHYAVENNHADVVRVLVESRADVNFKDNHQITPLLLAGSAVHRTSRTETINKFVKIVKILVDAKASVNDSDPITGNTALHHAVMLGSAEATKILLKDTRLDNYDNCGNTPLHIAANTKNIEILNILLEEMSHEYIDIRNQDNHTALHRAIYHGHHECIKALIRGGANLAAEIVTGFTGVNDIFSHFAEPIDFLTDVLNSCVQSLATDNSPSKKIESIIVDFGILAPREETQMAVVAAIIDAVLYKEQLAILQHPVVETFVRLKWEKTRIFLFLFILIFLSFVIFLSNNVLIFAHNDADYVVTRRIVAIYSCILLLQNIFQVIPESKNYLKLETLLSFICTILSLTTRQLFLIAGRFINCSKEETESGHWIDSVLHFISIAVLLSWMQKMLLVTQVLMWDNYPLMFYTVLMNILKVLSTFRCWIIGFVLSIAVLYHGNDQFHNFCRSIIKPVVIMMGEKLFKIENGGSTSLSVINGIVFMVSVMFASIVLINLINGLVVNDVQGLEKKQVATSSLKKSTELERHNRYKNYAAL
ncbi:serine/threonine-protein phosphatase 6 regulatory ankyrin repeat subunit B-like isoform X2 [Solenopsis invicta]|uniref:serine/threonine-protein phosphatase 6 regulatory ankyrin repeat subunit B-like isoform X2 n=1 Tax=Solenopsis invicta TaxID=13686 RepID=UPI00193E5318|nr:serine/threonine-protein phosphatase 6 regulatory ankyrin repeat subunit B-like isoform X2 [Solenopsis invicta]